MNQIGMVGLAVMGANLALNMASKGYRVSVWNYTNDLTEQFINGAAADKKNITGFFDLESFVNSLESPKKVFIMIRAGKPVDEMIDRLIPLLSEGDIIIDGGNSYFEDTTRRADYVESKGLRYIGTGVSGGEEGALHGPSMMPGGTKEAWSYVKDIFRDISAKAYDGEPCCDYVGEKGAGHFVKMVHNGIEYGDMELICEAYQFMRSVLELSNERMADIFAEWNQGELDSYLIEITGEILRYKDENGVCTLDTILDRAGQKGTGKWTGITALNEGVPLTLITEAVYARCLSARKAERVSASGHFGKVFAEFDGDSNEMLAALQKALYVSKIMSYAQGYELMRAVGEEKGWNLNYGGIASMWRGGCIIRSRFLSKIKEAFDNRPELENILMDDYFTDIVKAYIPSLRLILCEAIRSGIAMPAFMAALSYFDGMTTAESPANLLQAQRDYFGAHTYEIVGKEGHFHTDWTHESSNIVSGSYSI